LRLAGSWFEQLLSRVSANLHSQDVSELPDETLRQALINLQIAEFIYETHLFPELVYTFKHALTLEVTYKSLPLEARRGFHERIARSLESSSLGRFDEKSEILSHHPRRRLQARPGPHARHRGRV